MMKTTPISETPVDFTTTTPVDPRGATAKKPGWRGGLEAAFASAKGPGHANNEDSCIYSPAATAPRFCAVADGVGGGAHGDVASQALIQHCAKADRSVYRSSKAIVAWLKQGDTVVKDAINRLSDRPGASTLVGLWFLSAERAHVVNIGDCRAYRLSPKFLSKSYKISQLTVDQTYGNLNQPHPPGGNDDDPARMVGVGAVGNPPVLKVNLQERELFLLCSDGLHKFLDDAAIATIIGRELKNSRNLEAACQSLVLAAQINGSHDDVSALLVTRNVWFGVSSGYWLALLGALALGVILMV